MAFASGGYYGINRSITQADIDESTATFHGELTGKDYTSEAAMRDAEKKEAMRRAVPTAEELAFENMPIDQLRGVLERVNRSTEEKAELHLLSRTADAFKELYPFYNDSDHNAAHMLYALQQRLGANYTRATIADFEAAYNSLNGAGLITFNKGVHAAAAKEEAQRIAAKARDEQFNEEDAYTLSLDELRRRSGGTSGGRW